MNQTSWIAAFIFVGFIVYVTVKGQLPQYRSAIFGSGQMAAASAATQAVQNTESQGYQNQDPSVGPVTKAQ